MNQTCASQDTFLWAFMNKGSRHLLTTLPNLGSVIKSPQWILLMERAGRAVIVLITSFALAKL